MQLIEIVQQVLGINFKKLTPGLALRLGMQLVSIVPELLNLPPNHHLSGESRLKIEDVIAEFQKEMLPA